MTNSDGDRAAGEALDRIFMLLDEQHLRHVIDEPIDEAAATFRFENAAAFTYARFNQTIGDFVRHVYGHGLRLPRESSPAQACAEAIVLLETGYQGPHAQGYEAAVLDAMNPALDGIAWVLSQLAEIIKARERQKHVRWVFIQTLAPLEWSQRCHIAANLLDRLRPILPAALQRCTAPQLADEIPTLIMSDLGTSASFRHVSCPSSHLHS